VRWCRPDLLESFREGVGDFVPGSQTSVCVVWHCVWQRIISARWHTVLGVCAVAGRQSIAVGRWPITERCRCVLGRPKSVLWKVRGVAARQTVNVRRQRIRWRRAIGRLRSITVRRPITVRQWLGTRCWRHHACRSSSASHPSGEQHCRSGNRNAKAVHRVLCSVSPAKLNTEVGLVFRDSRTAGHRYPPE
jgi:hypothetical protein